MRLVRYGLVALSLTLLPPALVSGHAELVSTSPADGESLDAPPDEVMMVFESEIDPDGSGFTVTDANGGVVGEGSADLEVADRNEMRGDVAIDEPGVYTVAWTSVAADGFEQSGTFSFEYQADRAATEAPNTATSSPADARLLLAGLSLLLVAGYRLAARKRVGPGA